MKTFDFEARAADGRAVRGRSTAADEIALDRELEERGLTLLASRVASRTESSPERARLRESDLMALTTQLATVVGAGVRLVEGLESIGERLESASARRVVLDLVTALRGGSSLSDAMERHPRSFPDVYRASVRAGEASGALDTVLVRLARYIEWRRNMRGTTLQALIYPCILMAALSGLVLVLLYFVLPKFVKLLPGGRAELPVETRIVLGASDFLSAHWMILAGGAAALAAATWFLSRRARVREALHGALLSIPKFGRIAQQISTSRFASTASILQDAGCDVFLTLSVSGETCGNAALAASFQRAAENVRRGNTITAALEREPWVDSLLVQMVAVGEQSGELDRCLTRLVSYYDEEIPRAVKRFLAFLEPTLLLGSAMVVAFILLAALMPLFSLYDKIH